MVNTTFIYSVTTSETAAVNTATGHDRDSQRYEAQSQPVARQLLEGLHFSG